MACDGQHSDLRPPNGQWFIANPKLIWFIPESSAVVDRVDLGAVGPLPEQANLGDFMIPQRGIFAVGNVLLEVLDPSRHHAAVTCTGPEADAAGRPPGDAEQGRGAA